MGKKLEDALRKINKEYGENTVFELGKQEPIRGNLIPTGSLVIDKILNGGIARGRITEIYGKESSGKSTLSLQIAAECQKAGGIVAYIDAEQALDVDYARTLGVNVDELIFTQPSSGEQGMSIANDLAKTGDIDLIIVDSVAALTPQAELNGEIGDAHIGLLARLMGQSLRIITATLNETNCAIIFINQIRNNVSTGFSMGPNETTTGGNALKFYASQRIELRKTTGIKEGNDVIGNNVKIKVVKSKVGRPMQTCEIPLIFGRGFGSTDEAISLAVDYGMIEKGGAWFTLPTGEKLCGLAKVREHYEANKAEYDSLVEAVKSKLSGVEFSQEFNMNSETGIMED